MITRAKATEAARILGLGEEYDASTVNTAYRNMAKVFHPDVPDTGDAEMFARVDWAKHCLLKWLEGGGTPAPKPVHKPVTCPVCEGKGYTIARSGFRMGVRQHCMRCRGTGDLSFEPDKGAEF